MARLNIEDEFFGDVMLISDKYKCGIKEALGDTLLFLKLAQDKFKIDRSISEEEFKAKGFNEALFGIFAERVDGGIMAIRAEEFFGWLRSKVLAGSKAGKASAAARKIKYGTSKPCSEVRSAVVQDSFTSGSGVVQGYVPDSSSKPDSYNSLNTKNQSLSSEPSSSFSPSLRKNIYIEDRQQSFAVAGPIPEPSAQKVPKFDFEALYARYPRKEGKKDGLAKCKAQIKTQADFEKLSSAIDRYIEYLRKNKTEARFVKHFSTFMSKWEDWTDQDAGKVNLNQNSRTPTHSPVFAQEEPNVQDFPESFRRLQQL